MAKLRQIGSAILKVTLVLMVAYICMNAESLRAAAKVGYATQAYSATTTPSVLLQQPPPVGAAVEEQQPTPRRAVLPNGDADAASIANANATSASTTVTEAKEGHELVRVNVTAEPTARLRGKTYGSGCRWTFDLKGGGYPPVAFDGRVKDFVCPSMFRDMSDFVFGWPYDHFGEKVTSLDRKSVIAQLPPVPVIYSHVDHVRRGELGSFLRQLQQPYILVTGQSDWPIPSIPNAKAILRDANLVQWFAQNNDEVHDKITPIPIGLNCFEHGPEMDTVLTSLANHRPSKDNLLMINFGHTHPSREKLWSALCEGEDVFATCLSKSAGNHIRGNPHLVELYRRMASFKYVGCPRGNGMDTHRVWEALYLGAVPVVQHSTLDALYADLPVLLVDSLDQVNEDMLTREWARFERQLREGRGMEKLRREYWLRVIEGTRTSALMERDIEDVAPRRRCWGKAERRRLRAISWFDWREK